MDYIYIYVFYLRAPILPDVLLEVYEYRDYTRDIDYVIQKFYK